MFNKNIKSYFGAKGYTVFKSDLTDNEIQKIKNDLKVIPKILGAPCSINKYYLVYRESPNKLYVPHYYGLAKFGPPNEIKLSEGDNINIQFKGNLRPIQNEVINAYISSVTKNNYGGGLLELRCGGGKTICALNIISILKKKTLIIVHKEFLMNQWIERINDFLPNSKIGVIQGSTIDIDNKDIVIGMLQSLSMKDYDSNLFNSFGLTIIDEVHHISSEVFSKVLFKLVTKFMLGLSATMNRKDGTTKIFKMFLGEIVFKVDNKEQHNVLIRTIDYHVDDEEFNKIIYDYRGNPQYSTMITKLCKYNERSDFIIKILFDLFAENPNQQVMILAHNKSILVYLYQKIKDANIKSVGYYVGGMKDADLKETEGKDIVIATYSMAAEALDIKTLTTLIMATPKTDIEQSIGRILREKHKQAIVIDIIDSHTMFKNQWKKRKTFYVKENYKIVKTTNNLYIQSKHPNPLTDTNIWKLIFVPKTNKCDKNPNSDSDSDESDSNINKGACLIKFNAP
jgi:superfamily II DNA or RNA helicase